MWCRRVSLIPNSPLPYFKKKPISCFLPVGVLSHVLFGMKLFYSVRRSKAHLSISMRKMW